MMVFVNFPIRGNGLSNTITEPEVTKKKSMLNCLESIWVYLLFAKSIVQLWMLQFQRKYMVCECVAWSFKLQNQLLFKEILDILRTGYLIAKLNKQFCFSEDVDFDFF